MDINPSGIKVPNDPQEGFGKPVTNKGYTPGTFGVTVDKKVIQKPLLSSIPNVGKEVRNPEIEELLRQGRLAKKEGFNFTADEGGNVTEVEIPKDWAGDTDELREQLEKKEGETIILRKFIALSAEFTARDMEVEWLKQKLQNPSIIATLETISGEIKQLIDLQSASENIKINELIEKLQEFHKVVDRARHEVATMPAPTVAPEAQIENKEPVVVSPEEIVQTVPEASPKTPERINNIPKFFEVGQIFLLPKDEDYKEAEEAHWEVTELISKDGAMMMKQIDGNQKGRKGRFYYRQVKGFLERIEKEKQYGLKNPQEEKVVADQNTEKPVLEAPKTSPEASTKSSVLRPVISPARTEKPPTSSPEEVLQKNRAQKEVREKFEDMFTHDQKAFISLYTTASVDGATYTENETFRKHPYRDVIGQVFFANNIPVTYLTQEEVAKRNDIRREQEHLTTTSLGSVYNPARDSAQAAGRTGIFSKPKEITSVGGMIQNSKTVLKEAAIENPLREVILGVEKNTEKNPQEKLKKIASVLSARIKNLSNNPNNLLKGKLSWVVFAVVVGGAGVAASYVKSALDKQPVSVSESLNENEVEIKDTWNKYFHFGKTNAAFAEFPEDISKLSANQLKETLIQKYAKSYFDGTNNPRQNLLALGMFGDLVRDDTTKGTYDHLDDKARAELSYLWDALNDVSMATSGEKLQAKTYEAAIEEVKEKVTNKEK